MAQQPMKAKLNYKPKLSIEVFYSGGAVSLSKNGHLACACQDDIKVLVITFIDALLPAKHWSSRYLGLLQIVDTNSGAVIKTLSGVSRRHGPPECMPACLQVLVLLTCCNSFFKHVYFLKSHTQLCKNVQNVLTSYIVQHQNSSCDVNRIVRQ